MKVTIIISIVLILFSKVSYSQDTLLLKNNSKILVEITEVGLYDIKYENYPNRDGHYFSIDKSHVDYIIFSNGKRQKIEVVETIDTDVIYVTSDSSNMSDIYITKDTISNDVTNDNYSSSNDSPRDFFTKGQVDAAKFYKGSLGASTGTLVVSLLSPLVGLIPAVACSVTTPKPINLDYPDSQLFQNIDYQRGYISQSKRIKSKKVWRNWGIALGVNVIIVLMAQQ